MSEPIYQPRKPIETYEGNPCRKCSAKLRYVSNKTCIACQKLYQQRPDVILYHQSLDRKLYKKTYHQKPESKATRCRYKQTSKGKSVQSTATQNNRAKRLQAEGVYTTQEWLVLKEQYGNICLRCRKHETKLNRPLEPDHVIPVTKGGSNWITNIQPLCHDCNGMGGKGIQSIDYR